MALFQSRTHQRSPLPAGAHLNFMGGVSYDVQSPLLRLRMAASSCFFGEPMYYHRDAADDHWTATASRAPGHRAGYSETG